jgi:hypothetical protein
MGSGLEGSTGGREYGPGIPAKRGLRRGGGFHGYGKRTWLNKWRVVGVVGTPDTRTRRDNDVVLGGGRFIAFRSNIPGSADGLPKDKRGGPERDHIPINHRSGRWGRSSKVLDERK